VGTPLGPGITAQKEEKFVGVVDFCRNKHPVMGKISNKFPAEHRKK
jgi:hypothetical protein